MEDTFNKNFEYWKASNYATGVIYFQFCAFQYRNTRKLNLNIKIKCAYFDIEMRRIENRLRQLCNYWLSSIQIFYWMYDYRATITMPKRRLYFLSRLEWENMKEKEMRLLLWLLKDDLIQLNHQSLTNE